MVLQTSLIKKYSIAFCACFIAIILLAIYFLIFQSSLNVDSFLSVLPSISEFIEKKPAFSFFAGLLIYIAVCSIPFPFVSIITLSIGYLFGFTYGFILASFGSAIGALILFLVARRFIGVGIINRFLGRFPSIKSALQSSDMSVALGVRFIPGLPFFVPSVLFSLSQISAVKFYLSTQIGLLLTMAIYINAGATLSELTVMGENLFSIKLIVAMLFIALLPIIIKVIYKVIAIQGKV